VPEPDPTSASAENSSGGDSGAGGSIDDGDVGRRTSLVLSASPDLMLWLVRFVADAGADLPDFVVFSSELPESAARALLLAGHWEPDWSMSTRLIGGSLASCPVQTKMGPQDGTVFCR
jgi:hypothetical protein